MNEYDITRGNNRKMAQELKRKREGDAPPVNTRAVRGRIRGKKRECVLHYLYNLTFID
jgi:hypothetical protein